VCKLVVCGEADGNRIAVHVDPGSPDRWREEPYYSQLKAWAEIGADNGMQVVVYLKDTATVILPNKILISATSLMKTSSWWVN
jgi:hypothetical protein